jgi:alpha-amylase
MVDIVVNNIPSLSVNASTNATALTADGSRWTDPSYFHPFCWIDYSNQTSVEYCWLGDENLALMDVNTENQYVISTLQSWIQNFTTTYQIDGLRIDGESGFGIIARSGRSQRLIGYVVAAKHIPGSFWPGFCGAAGVFCIGEVYGSDIGYVARLSCR